MPPIYPALLATICFSRPDSKIWIRHETDRQGRYRHKKHWQIRCLGDPNPMADVPDQDSAKNQGKKWNKPYFAYPSTPGLGLSQHVESKPKSSSHKILCMCFEDGELHLQLQKAHKAETWAAALKGHGQLDMFSEQEVRGRRPPLVRQFQTPNPFSMHCCVIS